MESIISNTNGGIRKTGPKKQSGLTFQGAQCLLWVPERGSDVVKFREKSWLGFSMRIVENFAPNQQKKLKDNSTKNPNRQKKIDRQGLGFSMWIGEKFEPK